VESNPKSGLVDVREDRAYIREHARGALHIGKGVLERDLGQKVPAPESELILYCGGGYRSVLAADAARKMGYKNAVSLQGGYKAMAQAGWPMESESGGI
jgi:rhodanese-related sulfurtransferase